MNRLIAGILLFSLLITTKLLAQAKDDKIHFIKEFRCVTCANQNIADSQAPIAMAMKEEILFRLEQGESEENIRKFLLSRYGDYVSYRPLMKKQTSLLWWGPFLMFSLGIFLWIKKGKCS